MLHLTPLRWSSLALACGVLASPAQARIGETMEACVKRYGDSYAKIPALSGRSGEFCYLFKRKIESAGVIKDVSLRIEFMQGKASYLRIVGRYSEADTETLLTNNQGNDTWQLPQAINNREYYFTKTKPSRQACVYRLGENRVLEIFTPEFVAELNARRVALNENPDMASPAGISDKPTASSPASNAPEKADANPAKTDTKSKLEGF